MGNKNSNRKNTPIAYVRYLFYNCRFYFFRLLCIGQNKRHIGNLKEWKTSIFIGIIMLLGGKGMRTVGEVQLPSGVTSLIFAIVPLWSIIISPLFFKKAQNDQLHNDYLYNYRICRSCICNIIFGFRRK